MTIEMKQTLIGLSRCPHCGVAKPEMKFLWRSDCIIPQGGSGYGHNWCVYECTSCHLLLLAQSELGNQGTRGLLNTFPATVSVDEDIPIKARTFLNQAVASVHAPDGAAMLAGSAVDAMLKEKNLTEGSLYKRIDEAVDSGVITADMAEWAHEVRLGSNRPRHADEESPHTSPEEAKRSVEFATTLGHVLFVLPERIKRARQPNLKQDG